jgi:hypothetical protein
MVMIVIINHASHLSNLLYIILVSFGLHALWLFNGHTVDCWLKVFGGWQVKVRLASEG